MACLKKIKFSQYYYYLDNLLNISNFDCVNVSSSYECHKKEKKSFLLFVFRVLLSPFPSAWKNFTRCMTNKKIVLLLFYFSFCFFFSHYLTAWLLFFYYYLHFHRILFFSFIYFIFCLCVYVCVCVPCSFIELDFSGLHKIPLKKEFLFLISYTFLIIWLAFVIDNSLIYD